MPNINVSLPDGSLVEFPDGTSEDAINSALADYGKPPVPSIKLDPYQQATMAGQSMAGLGATSGPANPAEITSTLRASNPAAWIQDSGVFETASDLASDFLRRTGIDPSAQPGVPIIPKEVLEKYATTIPGTGISPLKLLAPQLESGVREGLAETASGFTEPGQALMLPFAGVKPVQAAFGVQALSQVPEDVKSIAEAQDLSSGAKATTKALINAAMAAGIGKHLLGDSYATQEGRVQQDQTGKYSGDGQGGASTEASSSGGVSPATGLEAQAQVLLKPEVANLATEEASGGRKNSLGDPATTTYHATEEDWDAWNRIQDEANQALKDKQLDEVFKLRGQLEALKNRYGGMPPEPPKLDELSKAENAAVEEASSSNKDLGLPSEVRFSTPESKDAPFANQLATIDENGKIVLNRQRLRAWLNSLPAANRAAALRGLLSEEGIHSVARKVIGDDAAAALWNSLSKLEQFLVESSYFGKDRKFARPDYSDAQMGHEYIRRSMQRLLRMNPREVVESYGTKAFFKEAAIDAAERVIQAVRKVLRTKPSTELSLMLDKMQQNVDAAKGKVSAAAPAAYAKDVSPSGEESDQTPIRLSPITPEASVKAAMTHLTENVAPNFRDFVDEVQKVHGDVRPGYLRDVWHHSVWNRLLDASGSELQNMVRAMGLSREWGPGHIADALPEDIRTRLREKVPDEDTRKRMIEEQSKRLEVIATLGNKLIKQSETGKRAFERSNVSADDVAQPEQRHKEPVIQTFSLEDAKDPANLGRMITEDARAFGGAKLKKVIGGKLTDVVQKGLPLSVTKRLVTLLDPTGKTHLVSAYRDSRRGPVVLDPLSPSKRHVPVESILNRYRVLGSVLLDEPVKNFHQEFPSVRAYEESFGQPAREAVSKMGSYEEPPSGEEPIPEQAVKPMTEADAQSIIEHVFGEVGSIESMDDVRQGLMGLKDSPQYRAAITALRKIGREQNEKEGPAVSPEQYLDRIAKVIYDNHSKAKSWQDFLNRTVEAGGGEVSQPPGVSKPAAKPEVKAKPTEEPPAAFDKTRQRVEEEWENLRRTTGAAIVRANTERDIVGKYDKVFNTSAIMGDRADKAIHVAAGREMTPAEMDAATMMVQAKFDPAELQNMRNLARSGMQRASSLATSLNPRERRIGKVWLDAATRVFNATEHAIANLTNPELLAVARRGKKELDASFRRAVKSGLDMDYWAGYVPGRYEGEFFNDNQVTFPGVGKLSILGRNWRGAKTFKSYAHAVDNGPYIPVTLDLGTLTGHSVRSVMNRIGTRFWRDSLATLTDPDSGQPIAREPIRRKNGELGTVSPEEELVTVNGKTLSVRKSFAGLIKDLTSPSAIQRRWLGRLSLEWGQRLKHTILLGDVFHLMRMGYYSMALTGGRPRYKGPLSVLEYAEKDIPNAVAAGKLTPEEAAWGSEQVPVTVQKTTTTPTGTTTGPATVMMSHREIANKLVKNYLNVGRIQDAIYKELIGHLPGFGQYNRWLFDKFTRGIMLHAAVENFKALNQAHPNINHEALMRDVAKDTNAFFASLGRQGIFKSQTMQDLARIGFLSPQWVEGLVRKEVGFASRLSGVSKALEKAGVPLGREGMPALGTLGKGVGRGLVAMIGLTQAINLITRHQPTWKNPEEDHKFDAYIPIGKFGTWLSPLSVFNELTHDLIRYNTAKETSLEALAQIGENKLSPYARAAWVLATRQTPTGIHLTSSKAIGMEMLRQTMPVPISFGRLGQAAGHALFPNRVAAPPPGSVVRQGFATLGLKTEPAQSVLTQVARAAEKYAQQNGIKGDTGWRLVQTDQPSYAKIRSALRNEDEGTASKLLNELRKTHTDEQVYKAMALWMKRPFTGSKRGEMQFLESLNPQQLKAYQEAELMRQQEFENFVRWLARQPQPVEVKK